MLNKKKIVSVAIVTTLLTSTCQTINAATLYDRVYAGVVSELKFNIPSEYQIPQLLHANDEIGSAWICNLEGYVTVSSLNIRKHPNKHSKILGNKGFGERIKYDFDSENPEWLRIKYNNNTAYISAEYVTDEKPDCVEVFLPIDLRYKGWKSWMGYKSFGKSSNQYKLQQKATTGNYGIRTVSGRYCVAIGSRFFDKNNVEIGTYIDLVLANNEIIPCVVADQKAEKDTDSTNTYTTGKHLCASEFIVNSSQLNKKGKKTGDISNVCKNWKSPVVAIRIYEDSAL